MFQWLFGGPTVDECEKCLDERLLNIQLGVDSLLAKNKKLEQRLADTRDESDAWQLTAEKSKSRVAQLESILDALHNDIESVLSKYPIAGQDVPPGDSSILF